jgi:hypothetical protein
LRHDLFALVEYLRIEHATPILGDEYRVDVEVVDDAARALTVGVCPSWLS